MEPWAAHLLIGYQGRYDVVTVAGSMALCLKKDRLPKKADASAIKSTATEKTPDALGSIASKTKGLRKIDGFVPLYWDEPKGKLWMEVSRFDEEFLYQVALATGLGSNPVGLDRGQLGDSRVVMFRRVGPKVLLVESNYSYRAVTDRAAERRAVDESFAQSVHWGFKVEAEERGSVLVDATAFFLRDAHGVAERLRQTRQGSYRLDDGRSALEAGRTKGFPKNMGIGALADLCSPAARGRPSGLLPLTARPSQAVTIASDDSLSGVACGSKSGFTPRRADSSAVGVFTIDFYDFATPVTEPVEQQFIARFRLTKRDPKAEVSEPVAPIVYYVDPGAPEPVRSALVEGASWWAKAFETAGFRNRLRGRGGASDDADPIPDLRLQRDSVGPPVDAGLVVRLQRDRSGTRRDPQRAAALDSVAPAAPDRYWISDRRAAARGVRRRRRTGGGALGGVRPVAEPRRWSGPRRRSRRAGRAHARFAHNFAAST